MIIVCPECHASFLVTASVHASGDRKVKCGACKHIWILSDPKAKTPPPSPATKTPTTPPLEASAAPPQPPPTEQAPPDPQKKINPIRILWLIIASLVLSLSMILVGGILFVLLHDPLIQTWPQLQSIYVDLGLAKPPETDRLILKDIKSERRYQDGAMHLVVDGVILSKAEKTQVIPIVKVEAMGPGGKLIQSWQIDPPTATLKSGKSVPFHSAILSPEGTVVEVNLSFAEKPHDEP